MNRFLAVVLVLFMVSCKTKSGVVEATKTASRMKANKIIENYNNNKNEFSTLYIKSDVQYSDGKNDQSLTAEIKIKKDQQILVSIKVLGFIVAKASITPTSVSYYEKISGNYFEGDFSMLSELLGTNLDFNKIQNLLLGRTIDDLQKGKYTESVLDQTYRLDDTSNSNTKKSFYFDAEKFFVKKQEITQIAEGRMLQANYSNQRFYNEAILPSNIQINTFQKKGNSVIKIDYNTITFNQELSFPYSVPNGYKRIIIK